MAYQFNEMAFRQRLEDDAEFATRAMDTLLPEIINEALGALDLSFETELLEWFGSRHSDVMESIRGDGKIPDEEALEAAIAAFADQFVGSDAESGEPEAEAQGDATTTMVDDTRTLPEEDISRAAE